jgi:hypothetical protein
VLIFKAGTREKGEDEFIRIVSIPRGSLDMLKSWLDEVAELTYTEGVAALGWKGLIEEYARVDGFWDSNDAETGTSGPLSNCTKYAQSRYVVLQVNQSRWDGPFCWTTTRKQQRTMRTKNQCMKTTTMKTRMTKKRMKMTMNSM